MTICDWTTLFTRKNADGEKKHHCKNNTFATAQISKKLQIKYHIGPIAYPLRYRACRFLAPKLHRNKNG